MKVFICFAHDERSIARSVAVALRNEGHSVFFDEDTLRAGEEYHARIRSEIASADLFIVLASKSALAAGAYALTEISIAEEAWPSAHGHVLPVLLPGVEVEELSPYLRSVHILRPVGNLDAEVAKRIAILASVRRRRVIAKTVVVTVLLTSFALAAARFIPHESREERISRHLAEDSAVRWLSDQEIPVWAFDSDAKIIVKTAFYEGPITSDVFSKELNFIRTYYPAFWSFLVNLDTKAIGPLVVTSNLHDDTAFMVLLDCSTLDPSAALTLAGLPATHLPGTRSVYHTKIGEAERVVTMVATSGSTPLLAYHSWKYPRALIAGSRPSVERILDRLERNEWSVPDSVRKASRVAGGETWFVATSVDSTRTLDFDLFGEIGIDKPFSIVGWTRGLLPNQIAKLTTDSVKKSWLEVSATIALQYPDPAAAQKAYTGLQKRLQSWTRLEVNDCENFWARTMFTVQPALLGVARAALRAVTTRIEGHAAFVNFDSRRVVLDNDAFTREYERLLDWSRACSLHAQKQALAPPDATLAQRVSADIERGDSSGAVDERLLAEMRTIIDPTDVLLPVLESSLHDYERSQRLWQYVNATIQNPRQLARWIERGLGPLYLISSRLDPIGTATAGATMGVATILSGLLVPGNLEVVMDDLSTTALNPQVAAMAISAAVCNQAGPLVRNDLWVNFIAKLSQADFQKTRLSDGIVIAIAACVLTAPDDYLQGRLNSAWKRLPDWIHQRLRPELDRQADETSRAKLNAAVAGIPAGEMKTALSK